MSKLYSGVRVVETDKKNIDLLYKHKKIDTEKIADIQNEVLPENLYIVLKDIAGTQSSVIVRHNDDTLRLVGKKNIGKLHPKNKEQVMAMDALLDPNIKIVVLTGRAGSGKTLLSTNAAMEALENKQQSKLVFSKVMSQIGKNELGILPGSTDEKLSPYLLNYFNNLEYMFGSLQKAQDAIEQYKIDFVPIQLMRGASFHSSFVVADEIQVLDNHSFVSIGTRIGEGSKIVLLGDLNQRDERIAKEKTGLYKFVNSEIAQSSPLVATIDLIKSERSEVASLFAEVFDV